MAPPFPSPTAKWHSTAYDSISPTRPELSAKGKAVVVTGGGTGIGAETARSFAAAGASRIALFGRRQQPLDETKASIEKEFGHVEVFVASTDITIQAQVDAAFDQFGKNGKIDVLISNAGVSGPLGSIGALDVKEFMDGVNANVGGNLIVAQAFLRHAAKGATVVDVNSAAAHVNMGPGFASYCVSKMGVFRLWDSVAFKSPDLRVFHVQPGVVDTEMNRQAGGVKALGYEDHGQCHFIIHEAGLHAYNYDSVSPGMLQRLACKRGSGFRKE